MPADKNAEQSPLIDNVWLLWRLVVNNGSDSRPFLLECDHVSCVNRPG